MPRTAAGVLAACTLGLSGCAVGITPDGTGHVLGWRVGDEANMLQQGAGMAAQIAGAVKPYTDGTPIAPIVAGVGAIGTLLAGGWGTKKAIDSARSEGRHVGWEEREAAAVPKPAAAPLPTGATS